MLQLHHSTDSKPVDRIPDMDVHAEKGELVLTAEIPGLHFADLDLRFDQDTLIIDADAWGDSPAGGEHHEHVHGSMLLPFGTDTAEVRGRITDSGLEVHIPMPPLPPGEAWLPCEELAY